MPYITVFIELLVLTVFLVLVVIFIKRIRRSIRNDMYRIIRDGMRRDHNVIELHELHEETQLHLFRNSMSSENMQYLETTY